LLSNPLTVDGFDILKDIYAIAMNSDIHVVNGITDILEGFIGIINIIHRI
jgi:hypothetical protein